jgi:hypothetical protein
MTSVDPPENPPSKARLPEGYYLLNFLTVLAEVESRDGDLLLPEEREILARFRVCSVPAQRLYVRMLTRKGPWFRFDGLHYSEIGDPEQPIVELLQAGFCDDQAAVEDLLPLLRREDLIEVLEACEIPIPRGQRREALLAALLQGIAAPKLITALRIKLRPVRPLHGVLWRRIFLMFYGNFEQDLSSFVIADTGHIHYESYAIDPGARSFQSRSDVDYMLSLQGLRERLGAVTSETELADLTQATLAMEAHPGVRQQRRFQGLLNDLGHSWERAKQAEQAMACYSLSERPPARERRVRLLAAQGDLEAACQLAMALFDMPKDVGEARFARSFLTRQQRKASFVEPWLQAQAPVEPTPALQMTVPRHPSNSVEMAALEAARNEGWEGFFAENSLWRALFGLAFWEELFAPIQGAFQHRFQNAPLDLRGGSFYGNRLPLIEEKFTRLEGLGGLSPHLLGVAERKWGVANAFLNWRHLTPSHLSEAFRRIEPKVALGVLSIMVHNPTAFDSGFPDLFLYRPESEAWKLWEVKGPGDTLRPEQEWWLQQFNRLGCLAKVAWIRFEDNRYLAPPRAKRCAQKPPVFLPRRSQE